MYWKGTQSLFPDYEQRTRMVHDSENRMWKRDKAGTKTGKKETAKASLDAIWDYITESNAPTVYEVHGPDDHPVLWYADIEYNGEEVPDETEDKLEWLLRLLKGICTVFDDELNVQLDPREDFVVGDGCRPNRVSFHLVCPNLRFASMLQLRHFMKAFFPQQTPPGEKDDDDICPTKYAVDTAVYTKHRLWRTMYCAKEKYADYPLIPFIPLIDEQWGREPRQLWESALCTYYTVEPLHDVTIDIPEEERRATASSRGYVEGPVPPRILESITQQVPEWKWANAWNVTQLEHGCVRYEPRGVNYCPQKKGRHENIRCGVIVNGDYCKIRCFGCDGHADRHEMRWRLPQDEAAISLSLGDEEEEEEDDAFRFDRHASIMMEEEEIAKESTYKQTRSLLELAIIDRIPEWEELVMDRLRVKGGWTIYPCSNVTYCPYSHIEHPNSGVFYVRTQGTDKLYVRCRICARGVTYGFSWDLEDTWRRHSSVLYSTNRVFYFVPPSLPGEPLTLRSVSVYTQLAKSKANLQAWLESASLPSYRRRSWAPFKLPPGVLNTFRGFNPLYRPVLVPLDQMDPRILQLIFHVISAGDWAMAMYQLKYIQHCRKFPHIKPEVANVMKGAQGIGKGTFVTGIVQRIFGSWNVLHEAGDANALSSFNAVAYDKLVVFFDEALFPGDPRVVSSIKHFLANKSMIVNEKYQAKAEAESFHRAYIASNNDWVINTDPKQRRYVIMQCKKVYTKQWLHRLNEDLEHNPTLINHFLGFLDRYVDVDEWIPNQNFPFMPALYEQIINSAESHVKHIQTALNTNVVASQRVRHDNSEYTLEYSWGDVVPRSVWYRSHVAQTRGHRRAVGERLFWNKMQEVIPSIALHSQTRHTMTQIIGRMLPSAAPHPFGAMPASDNSEPVLRTILIPAREEVEKALQHWVYAGKVPTVSRPGENDPLLAVVDQ